MSIRHRLLLWACLGLLLIAPTAVRADVYRQTNLTSSIPGMAPFTDANLKNPWGMSFTPNSPFWASDQVTGKATLYSATGQPQPQTGPLIVTIPGSAAGPSGPTGAVFNSTASDFNVPGDGKSNFIFANLNGTISAWNNAQGTTAVVAATTAGAIYTGLALGTNAAGANFLYAANMAANRIDVFNGSFAPATLSGSFSDPSLPTGLAVYGIQNIGGSIFVTYANQVRGQPGGAVNQFDVNGNLIRRISANGTTGPLQAPWGVALAPATFGQFGGDLLVGGKNDGHISAFNPTTGAFLGQLLDNNGNPIANPGLWGLAFGNAGPGSNPNSLYFFAGINNETEGLFARIDLVAPEPGSIVLCGIGGVLLIGAYRRRRRS